MKLHEYQAKELFRKFGIPVGQGEVASTPEQAENIAKKIGAPKYAVKAQIHAGGRGKGGGIKLATTTEEVRKAAESILNKPLITPQTGPEGKIVRKVLVEKATAVKKELYCAITIDRASECPVIIACAEGGVEIEEVAKRTPEAVIRQKIDVRYGLLGFQSRTVAVKLGLDSEATRKIAGVINSLYKCFIESDASLVEINPLVITENKEIIALDAKVDIDDNSLFRHKDLEAQRDTNEETPLEVKARAVDISYVSMHGNIGCMVNGAGLAMATMDIIKHTGGEPANFLDVGGGANAQQVEEAFKIILADKRVKSIFVNIFGGIARCDVIAEGVISTAKKVEVKLPIIVRLDGTNAETGRKMLSESGLKFQTGITMDEAAKLAVAAAK
ncbi:MAG: ADP-forming succinate--CoA ligase subunit beta [Planctomycetota bacterium]